MVYTTKLIIILQILFGGVISAAPTHYEQNCKMIVTNANILNCDKKYTHYSNKKSEKLTFLHPILLLIWNILSPIEDS